MILRTQENRHKKVIKAKNLEIDAVNDKLSKLTYDARKMRKSLKTQIKQLPEHPAVKEVMQHFPGARIAAVRPAPQPEAEADVPDEPDELKEDGTTR